MDDARLSALARDFQQGDLQSFRLLVEGLTRKLIAMAYRYSQDWESARDLCQETWLKVYQQIQRYDCELPFRTWLLTVHRNTCLSYLRKPFLRRELATSDEVIALIGLSDPSGDPWQRLQRQELGRRLRAALAGLTESQRRVFTCVDLEQADQQDAARALGMNPTTLRTTLHFARKRVARLLLKMEDET
jgi:RNA polymerase sigma-70 factor (ECF subfamily)